MPELELTVASLSDALTLDYIASVMLWPGQTDADRRSRERARLAAQAASIRAGAKRFALESPGQAVPNDVFAAAVSAVGDAPRLMDVQAEIGDRWRRGIIACWIFSEVLSARRAGRQTNLNAVKSDISIKFSGKPGYGPLSMPTIELHIWAPFACVAHLWAANKLLASRRLPCALDELPTFLAVSERLRRDDLESSRRPMIAKGAAWTVPADLPLPELAIAYGNFGSEL